MRRHLTALLGVVIAFAVVTPAAAQQKQSGLVKAMVESDAAMKAGKKDVAARRMAWVALIGPFEEKAFSQWKSIGMSGALAASRGDTKAFQASCTKCHDKYKDLYRAKNGGGGAPKPVD
jgi:hypothetical protein